MSSPETRTSSAQDKVGLREETWRALQQAGASRFPGARGRIPNFQGAEAAADRLAASGPWRRAAVLKCNPDSPQRRVRYLALRAGKTVLMAVPKLARERPFLALEPDRLGEAALWKASSIKGASALGRPTGLEEVPSIDLVISGCVAVGRDGARLGKGGGYADLEYGLLREAGKVGARTPVATTVHPLQVLDAGVVPVEPHDLSVDWIVTPEQTWRCTGRPRRPHGIRWGLLDDERLEAIPALRARAPHR